MLPFFLYRENCIGGKKASQYSHDVTTLGWLKSPVLQAGQ